MVDQLAILIHLNNRLHSSFFIHGMRYQNLPDQWSSWIAKESLLKLISEPTNEHDPNAVAIYTYGGKKLGYVPNFYSKEIYALLENGANPVVRVVYLNDKSTPHWWVKVHFECDIPLKQNIHSDELAPECTRYTNNSDNLIQFKRKLPYQ